MDQRAKAAFDARFAPWQVELPAADLANRRRGTIRQNGWTIHYRFDRENDREFIEYFASHRMTNDTLQRIYSDGEYALVAACQEFYDEGNPSAYQAYLTTNRRFYTLVHDLGLD
jgi:hypothetical protein